MKRKVFIAIGVVVAALIGVGAYIFTTLDDQTEVTVDSAVEDLRESLGPEQPPRPGLPKQGVYSYTVTGKEKIVSALTVERTLPTSASMIVRHRQDGYETETKYSKEHVELSRYELQPDGAYVTFAVTKLIVGPVRTTRERSWSPKLLRFPLEGKTPKGGQWGGDFTAGDLKLNVQTRLKPAETIDVGGTPVEVQVIEAVQKITGEYTGDRTETFWFAPKLGLTVRYTIDSSLEGPTDLDFVVDQKLTSIEPAV